MTKRKDVDLLDVLLDFQKGVLERKPEHLQMLKEVQLMKFKIRPVRGDITLLKLEDQQFIEILWSLGKLDEFFVSQLGKVNLKQRGALIEAFEKMHHMFQDRLNKLDLKPERTLTSDVFLEMEIFKENSLIRKPN